MVVAVGYYLGRREVQQKPPIADLTIGSGMGPDLMSQNRQLTLEQLEELIAQATNNGDWQTGGSSSLKLFRSIVTSCGPNGCETFTYDHDGNLVPASEKDSDLTHASEDPFGDPIK